MRKYQKLKWDKQFMLISASFLELGRIFHVCKCCAIFGGKKKYWEKDEARFALHNGLANRQRSLYKNSISPSSKHFPGKTSIAAVVRNLSGPKEKTGFDQVAPSFFAILESFCSPFPQPFGSISSVRNIHKGLLYDHMRAHCMIFR